jgi:hypothetical protein
MKSDGEPMKLSEKIAAFDLVDASGEIHRLGDYWLDRPAVVVFVRHFG